MVRDSAVLRSVLARPTVTGLVLDFDGVLSPIVADPAESVLPAATAETLTGLARHLRLLAVISGRQLSFLRDRIQVPHVLLLGSYGMETLRNGAFEVAPEAEDWLPVINEVSEELEKDFGEAAGILVERKSVSVAVHWRNSPDPAKAESLVSARIEGIAGRTGLHTKAGKLVLELLPSVDLDKGTALQHLIASEGLRHVVYVGDDVGDIPAMRVALDHGRSILVDHGHETDPELLEVASEIVDGVDEMAEWLGRLLDALDTSGGGLQVG